MTKEERFLELKIGAQVVLMRNHKFIDELVNGSRGVVTGFGSVTAAQIERASGATDPKITKAFKECPEVLFDNGQTHVIFPAEFSLKMGEHKIARWQCPLKLAWALTIHKSQGMSLDKVECYCGNAFDDGHVYVALSRCRSIEGTLSNVPTFFLFSFKTVLKIN